MIENYFKKSELHDFCKKASLNCSGSKEEMILRIKEYLKNYKVAPRYLRGLTREEKFVKMFEIRYNTLKERSGVKKIYEPSKIDKKYSFGKRKSPQKKSRKPKKISKYTEKWNKKFGGKTLEEKSKKSGVPKSILKKVYNKGLAAWRGGAHRPGASQQSWAIARVNSFLTCGKTFYFPDHLLAKDAMKKSPKAREFWKKQSCKFKKMGKKTPSR